MVAYLGELQRSELHIESTWYHRTVLEELAKIKSGDVVLPTQTEQGRYTGTVRLRCVSESGEAQKVLLNRLGVTLPRRLRRIDEVVPM